MSRKRRMIIFIYRWQIFALICSKEERGGGDETEGATEQKQQIKAQTAALPHNQKKETKTKWHWWMMLAMMDGWMNEWMNDWVNEWMNGWMGRWMNGLWQWRGQWMSTSRRLRWRRRRRWWFAWATGDAQGGESCLLELIMSQGLINFPPSCATPTN